MSGQVSRGSAGDYQADERAGAEAPDQGFSVLAVLIFCGG